MEYACALFFPNYWGQHSRKDGTPVQCDELAIIRGRAANHPMTWGLFKHMFKCWARAKVMGWA